MTVHFIGAGPGAADLITLRGRDLIARSPVCLYAGSLVPRALLDHCPPGARVVDTAGLDLDAIVAEFVAADRAGLDVARLHSGDLSIWSAVGEQMRRLDRLGLAYTVTPGVPAFAAAAAALGRELTLPEVAQSVVLTRTPGRASSMPRARDAGRLRRDGRDPGDPPVDPRAGPGGGGRCCRSTAPTARRRWWPGRRGRRSAWCAPRWPRIAAAMAAAPVERTGLILVGAALGAADFRESALYDTDYVRRFR